MYLERKGEREREGEKGRKSGIEKEEEEEESRCMVIHVRTCIV